MEPAEMQVDVVVAGSGAGGLTAAVVAARAGLRVLVVEKSEYFGGTTALSGGAPWIPGNHLMGQIGETDTRDEAVTYLRAVLGNQYDSALIGSFLDNAPQMLHFMERHSEVRFKPFPLPDYESELPGAKRSRSLLTQDYDGTRLGPHLATLRPPKPELVLFGSMQVEGADIGKLRTLFNSPKAFAQAAGLVLKFAGKRLRHGRGTRLANGNALAGRLLRSALDAGVTLWRNAPARRLVTSAGAVQGVIVEKDGAEITITARYGVVLASGGFGANTDMRAKYIPFADKHVSIQPDANTGDGINMARDAGAVLNEDNAGACIWTPVSVMRRKDGSLAKYPHIIMDRYMPGSLVVDQTGKRFVNEAGSYQNFVKAMHQRGLSTVYLIANHNFLRKYGMGLARPRPFPVRQFIRNGYLVRAASLLDLAQKIAVNPAGLEQTVADFNTYAQTGADLEFHRGDDRHSRFRGDAEHGPNPSIGAIGKGPYYALALIPGDLGTVMGLNTNGNAQVLDKAGQPIGNLYAAGIDMNSIMRGLYPGGGSSIGPAMTFGYIAANHIAARAKAGNPVPGEPVREHNI